MFLYTLFHETLTTTGDRSGLRGAALPPKLPGFASEMMLRGGWWAAGSLQGKRLRCLCSGGPALRWWAMHDQTARCPCLNATAQPRPLPGCNHNPGTAMFNSPLTTKSRPHFLPGKADEPHLPFQGTESMFTTTREAIDWHIRAVLKVSPFTAGEGVEVRALSQVRGSQVWGGGGPRRREMPAGPRGEQVQE